MQVIITVAGLGQRFKDDGYDLPKPIISVLNKPAIVHLIESFSPGWKLFFVLAEHLKTSAVESIISSVKPDCKIIYIKHSKRGPIDTVLAAIPYLKADESVAVSYCDYAMIWKPADFQKFVVESNCDAAVVSYRGFQPTYLGPNTYAHLLVDEQSSKVLKLQEKKLFGSKIEKAWTSAGFYYFKNVQLLQQGLALQEKNNLKFGEEFYTSLAVQSLIEVPCKVLNYEILYFMQMGTPADIQRIEAGYKSVNNQVSGTKDQAKETAEVAVETISEKSSAKNTLESLKQNVSQTNMQKKEIEYWTQLFRLKS